MAETATIALTGGTLIDGSGADPLNNTVILISGGKVKKVGRIDAVKLPKGCLVVDVTGQTVMPGMMDLHVHLNMGELDVVIPSVGLHAGLADPWPLRGLKAFAYARRTLEAGFTTLRDVGDMGNVAVSVRNAIDSGIVEGPRVISCGQFLTTTGGHVDLMPLWLRRTDEVTNVADGVDGVVQAVRRQWKMKNDWVKFYATGGLMDPEDKQEFTDEEMVALVGEAHSRDMLACAHCMYAKGTLAALKAGLDSVEHGTDLTEEIVDLMVKNGTYLVPTLTAPDVIVTKGLEFGMPRWYIDRMQPHLDSQIRSFKMALQKGVKIATGTDAGFNAILHGANASELQYLVRHGMTPMQAIVAATSSSAALLRKQDELGTIEPGKLADIIVVDGDPLVDIAILQDKAKITLVMKEGSILTNRMGRS
jgi:imidazolonepropionase-like amidohydrolase